MQKNSTAPAVYKFGLQDVRIVMLGGEPWFVAADICAALEIANSRDALLKLDGDEKGVGLTDTLGGKQEVAIVSESGMYTLVLRCRDAVKPGTIPHRFRKWVTAEVLPAIRKSGAYASTAATPEIPLLIARHQQRKLEDVVHALAMSAGERGKNYRSVCQVTWGRIREHFGLREYSQLPAAKFDEAVEFIDALSAEWEILDRESLPSLLAVDEGVRHAAVGLSTNMLWLREWWRQIGPGVKAMNRNAAATVHDRFTDGMIFANSLAEKIGHELPYEYARDYPFMAGADAQGEYEKQRCPKSKAVTPRQSECPVAVYRNVNRPVRLASPEVL